eukprot:TRINITY_DN7494_c0_g1_i1.p1 TRINITY_DN7494_c0_g1~~TRINITY_DN7494_c0_g1_i1.p1  ORF type:complete len:641 (+),score=149.38 TRINITY_DN7494_c0_g1_i1:119-2041(+)
MDLEVQMLGDSYEEAQAGHGSFMSSPRLEVPSPAMSDSPFDSCSDRSPEARFLALERGQRTIALGVRRALSKAIAAREHLQQEAKQWEHRCTVIREDLLSSLRKELPPKEQPQPSPELRRQLAEEMLPTFKQQLKEDMLPKLKQDVFEDMLPKLKQDVFEEMLPKLKQDMLEAGLPGLQTQQVVATKSEVLTSEERKLLRSEMLHQLLQSMGPELVQRMHQKMDAELPRQIRQEMQAQVSKQPELVEYLLQELKEQLRPELLAQANSPSVDHVGPVAQRALSTASVETPAVSEQLRVQIREDLLGQLRVQREELQAQLHEDLQKQMQELEARFGLGAKASASTANPVASDWTDKMDSLRSQVEGKISDVGKRIESLQEVMDSRVLVQLWQAGQQLQETGGRIERLNSICQEGSAKMETQEARMSLTRLDLETQERQFQALSRRVEELRVAVSLPQRENGSCGVDGHAKDTPRIDVGSAATSPAPTTGHVRGITSNGGGGATAAAATTANPEPIATASFPWQWLQPSGMPPLTAGTASPSVGTPRSVASLMQGPLGGAEADKSSSVRVVGSFAEFASMVRSGSRPQTMTPPTSHGVSPMPCRSTSPPPSSLCRGPVSGATSNAASTGTGPAGVACCTGASV